MRRMTRVQMARLPRLLWMYYSPAELIAFPIVSAGETMWQAVW
jgi:hypothetical protein